MPVADDGTGSGDANGLRGGVTEPAHLGDERTALMGFLQRQRDLVIWKLRDTPDEVLRSVSAPSEMTLHGIVRHLANVERSWIRDVFAAEEDLEFDWTDDDPDGEFHVPPEVPMSDLLAAYAEESARCDVVVESTLSLDEVSDRREVSLRWILMHLIEETGRHLGHIDLLREQADGMVGEDPG